MNFHVGQKVVCINDTYEMNEWNDEDSGLDGLTRGEVYEIRWVGEVRHPYYGRYPGIRVSGIDRGEDIAIDDLPYDAARFRPLVSQSTDLALFTHHLTDQPVDA